METYQNSSEPNPGIIEIFKSLLFPIALLLINIVFITKIMNLCGFSLTTSRVIYILILCFAAICIGRNLASIKFKNHKNIALIGAVVCFLIEGMFKAFYYFVSLTINLPETFDATSYIITESLFQIYGGLLLSPVSALISYFSSKWFLKKQLQ